MHHNVHQQHPGLEIVLTELLAVVLAFGRCVLACLTVEYERQTRGPGFLIRIVRTLYPPLPQPLLFGLCVSLYDHCHSEPITLASLKDLTL